MLRRGKGDQKNKEEQVLRKMQCEGKAGWRFEE